MTILLIAGTAEARRLSHQIAPQAKLISSLAGVTQSPAELGGTTRSGGFGGPDGLAAFITTHGVRLIIDATHPFAVQMSRNASIAAAKTGVDILQVLRPPWPNSPSWTRAPTLRAAAAALPAGARAFLATGRGSIADFQHRADVTFILRVMDEAPGPCPFVRGQFLVSQPPFTVAEEVQTLRQHRIDWLVTRNSGGQGGIEKLRAAAQLGINIIMTDRPELPAAARVETVDQAMIWLTEHAWLGT